MIPADYYNTLETLIRRRRTLINRKGKLEEVSLEITKEYYPLLRLEGSCGNEFKITHPIFLQRFYTTLHTSYEKKIQAIETKINDHQHNNF